MNSLTGPNRTGVSPDFGFTTTFKMLQLIRIVMASAGQVKVKDLFATEPDY